MLKPKPQKLTSEIQQVWNKADNPPKPRIAGQWSYPVVVVTNLGNVMTLSYSWAKEKGGWQKKRELDLGEEVAYWTELPSEFYTRDNDH